MTVSEIITNVAAAHSIPSADLAAWITARGWDFSTLDGEPDAELVTFLSATFGTYAEIIAANQAKIIARQAAREAAHAADIAARTDAAKAHPEAECGKCAGKGHIRGFDHVSNGRCFQCEGTGVLRRFVTT